FRSAKILDIPVEEKAAELLSRCSRGTPRVANRILRRMRDYAQIWGNGRVTPDIVARGLQSLEIDDAGLDKLDREVLRTIITKYKGGPVGSETLAISIGESVDTLEDIHEPFLIQGGFLKRTSRGRMVTEKAYQHLCIPFNQNEDQRFLF
ncbi:MAG TPA: Holliday junction DNA helicase RuvB C-terminal domain-containing protein, partial [Spirochaetia bacterium]|nr:Holliday junction DNA helicase RuvB C-terminal domain-containing protein [Spirochaetia bacterium]